MQRRFALLICLTTLLCACDATLPEEGLHSDTVGDNNVTDFATSASNTITGRSAKGPLIDATIQVFELDGAGYPANPVPLAQTQSDAQGFWQIELPDRSSSLLIQTSGGRYVDEADTSIDSRREIILGENDILLSILPPDANSVAVTILTHALVEKSRRETDSDNFEQVLTNNRMSFANAMGVDVLSVLPSSPLAPNGSTDENRYAMYVGGIANAVNALSIAMDDALPTYLHIDMVIRDLVDCEFDGRGIAGDEIWSNGLASVPTLSLNQEIVRFYNNNALAYANIELNQINNFVCAQVGGSRDTSAPVIQLGDLVELAAIDAQGVLSSTEVRATVSAQWDIVDDRIGPLDVQTTWPSYFSLGDNQLTVEAIDAWGNAASSVLTVRVTDQSPPVFSAPQALSFAATGDLTQVTLSRPDVMDNVSADNAISVTNDAPVMGFPPGVTSVTWMATDEAGLTSLTTQAIEITSLAPTVTNAPGELLFDGSPVDFSVFFIDADQTTLSFMLVGLPPGSGLNFDPETGVLSGEPLQVDVDASPLLLTVQASDGPNVVEFSLALAVPPLNTPPAFAFDVAQVILDEDFPPQLVPINVLATPVSEQEQEVTFTVELLGDDLVPVQVQLIDQSLSITAIDNASGDAVVRVTADDGQLLNSVFSVDLPITVNPVNDAPESLGVATLSGLVTGSAFALDLSEFVQDVDDDVLEFSVDRVPDNFVLDTSGLLSGIPQPVNALAEQLALTVVVQDAAGASVIQTVNLQINDPDSDGDGVSDYNEMLAGFDPFSNDSDSDGFGDSLEMVLSLDRSTQAIFFVKSDGDDIADGMSFNTALGSLEEASIRVNQLPPDQAGVILIATNDQPYVGRLQIDESSALRALVGSVDFTTGSLADQFDMIPSTRLQNPSARSVLIRSCAQCELYFMAIADGQGMQVSDSTLFLQGVHWQSLRSTENGAGLLATTSNVVMEQVLFADNLSSAAGGAIALALNSTLNVTDSRFNGNGAAEQGAVVLTSDSSVNLDNVQMIGNAAPSGVLVAATDSSVRLHNVTAGYNHVTRFNLGELISCTQTVADAVTTCVPVDRAVLSNSVAILNRDASGRIVDLDRSAVTGGYNLLEPTRAVELGEVEAFSPVSFAANFGLTPEPDGSLALAINGGNETAQSTLFKQFFTVANDTQADSGQLDLGYHQRRPLIVLPPDKPKAVVVEADGPQYGPTVIDLTLAYADPLIPPLGPGQQVMVRALSIDPRVQVTSSAPLLEPNGFRLATDLGDGRYRIWTNSQWDTGRDQLELRINNSVESLILLPTCSSALCDGIGLTRGERAKLDVVADPHRIVSRF